MPARIRFLECETICLGLRHDGEREAQGMKQQFHHLCARHGIGARFRCRARLRGTAVSIGGIRRRIQQHIRSRHNLPCVSPTHTNKRHARRARARARARAHAVPVGSSIRARCQGCWLGQRASLTCFEFEPGCISEECHADSARSRLVRARVQRGINTFVQSRADYYSSLLILITRLYLNE